MNLCLPVNALFCAAAGTLFAQEESDRPNIVVFLADDMGRGDCATYGDPLIQTPNLDKLASRGVKFTQCYSACGVCSPPRAAILTGRTPYRNGVWRHIELLIAVTHASSQ